MTSTLFECRKKIPFDLPKTQTFKSEYFEFFKICLMCYREIFISYDWLAIEFN